jgi:DNA-binding XRE family transcriptional regulator
MTGVAARPEIGSLLREWRGRRRMSQLDLALKAGVSARHLSFLETGRSRPSAEMVVQLAEHLDVPLRVRNGPVRDAIDRLLRGHEPYPAVVVDRHWGMVAGNRSVGLLTAGVAPELLEPPVNVLRLSLHPDGLAPRIVNLPEWRAHLLDRLGRQAVVSGDPALFALHEELSGYQRDEPGQSPDLTAGEIAVPLRVAVGDTELSFLSTATTFGTAIDVTVSELAIESFFPADAKTADYVRSCAESDGPRSRLENSGH